MISIVLSSAIVRCVLSGRRKGKRFESVDALRRSLSLIEFYFTECVLGLRVLGILVNLPSCFTAATIVHFNRGARSKAGCRPGSLDFAPARSR